MTLEPERQAAEEPASFALPLQEGLVTQLQFDFAFGIHIDASVHVRIEGPFVLDRAGASQTYDPEQTTSLGPLLELRGSIVTDGLAAADGSLSLRFADGSHLLVPPDQHYEAFTINGREALSQGGFLIVSKPGGGLSIWGKQAG